MWFDLACDCRSSGGINAIQEAFLCLVYLVSGLFALGGVALAGLFAEIRAARESRARENSELTSLKRETYSKAIHQVELVASRVARWAGANDEERAERSHAFWDELTLAYQITDEVRIIARTQEPRLIRSSGA